MLSQKIALLSERVIRGNTSVLDQLSEGIEAHDKTLKALDQGGKVPGFDFILSGTSSNEIHEFIAFFIEQILM